MKKYLFPLFATLLFVSCSSDKEDVFIAPQAPPSFLNATINGTPYVFDSFIVETVTVVEPDYTYVDLHVIASIAGDDSKSIEFNLEKDAPGTESIYFFYLMNGEEEFDTDHTGAAFNTNLTINANKRLVGTFSGALARFDDTSTAEVTNGSFDISYSD